MVEARTVGAHPLVGVRRWRAYLHEEWVVKPSRYIDLKAVLRGKAPMVPSGRTLLSIETESYDHTASPTDYVGMHAPFIGMASDQLRIWELYFRNLVDAYKNEME